MSKDKIDIPQLANKQSKNIDELEELINLAEKVSQNIDSNSKRASTFYIYQLTSLMLFSMIFVIGMIVYLQQNLEVQHQYSLLGMLISSLLIFGYLLLSIKILIKRKRMLKEVETESKILANLLDMIHSYKEVVNSNLSVVKKALIDMRLSRIKFSTQK